ncbi:hypothetical protein KL939_001599 [Ogataea angusta]|nr:hypothetical protein KL939_001599 [Ogataea angusta]
MSLDETTLRTKEAVHKILEAKLNGTRSSKERTPTFVKYTPTSVFDEGENKQRIIKIKDKELDPTLPPSVRIRKTPQGPDEAPVPVMHEETTVKLTKEDQRKWYIPPAVSNWKNTKGFTIDIDKRLAAVGQTHSTEMSDKFGDLSDALKDASEQAKKELKLRAKLKNQLEQQKVLENQEKLRAVAQEARSGKRSKWADDEPEEVSKIASKREQARAERRRRAELELRRAKMGTETKVKVLAAEDGREISERVALGVASRQQEANNPQNLYDARLYLKGAASNVRHSDDQLYDKPLFEAQDAINDIYRARSGAEFQGDLDRPALGHQKGQSSAGPIEFERDVAGQETENEHGLKKRRVE